MTPARSASNAETRSRNSRVMSVVHPFDFSHSSGIPVRAGLDSLKAETKAFEINPVLFSLLGRAQLVGLPFRIA